MSIKIGIFGTCRIDNYNIEDFKQIETNYPYIYRNDKYTINIRPLGYSTSSSDVLQNLILLKSGNYNNIKSQFIYKNVLLKHGGTKIITDTDYKYLVLEICSIKKIIHKDTGYIFPYEIEGHHNKRDYEIISETFNETVNNIIKIQKYMNCPIILLPPITKFNGEVIKGVHENTVKDKILNYRNDIIERLKKASKTKNIYLLNWNDFIIDKGIKNMIKDQFHFTTFGKKYISQQIYNFILNNK